MILSANNVEKVCFVCQHLINRDAVRIGPPSDKYPRGLYRHPHHGPASKEWRKISQSEVAGLLQLNSKEKEVKKMEKTKETTTKSEFGHSLSKQAGQIDEMIILGEFTITQITNKLGLTPRRVNGHIRHLANDKKVPVEIDNKGIVAIKSKKVA